MPRQPGEKAGERGKACKKAGDVNNSKQSGILDIFSVGREWEHLGAGKLHIWVDN